MIYILIGACCFFFLLAYIQQKWYYELIQEYENLEKAFKRFVDSTKRNEKKLLQIDMDEIIPDKVNIVGAEIPNGKTKAPKSKRNKTRKRSGK